MRIFAAFLSIAIWTSSACAQYQHMYYVRVSEADFQRMWASMPANAPAAAVTAFHRFEAESRSAIDRMIARTRRFERGEASDTWEALNADWWEMRNQLEARLVSDVAGTLETDEQRAAWTRAALADRRRYVLQDLKVMQRQREPFDPIIALEAIELSDAEDVRLELVIDGCAARIDASMADFERVNIVSIRDRGRIASDDPDGNQRRSAIANQWLDAIKSLTKTCDESRTAIANELDPEHRDAFLEHIDQQVYPEAFLPCPAQLFAEGLRMTPDVPAEKRAAIETIYADYLPSRDVLRRQILDTIKRYERGDHPLKREYDALVASVERGEINHEQSTPRFHEMQRSHPANPLLERRHDLAIDAARRMRAMFDDAEFAALPPALRLALTGW